MQGQGQAPVQRRHHAGDVELGVLGRGAPEPDVVLRGGEGRAARGEERVVVGDLGEEVLVDLVVGRWVGRWVDGVLCKLPSRQISRGLLVGSVPTADCLTRAWVHPCTFIPLITWSQLVKSVNMCW